MISRVEANVGSEPLFSKFEIFSVHGAGFKNHPFMLITWLHSRMHFRDMATKGDCSAEGRIAVLAFKIESFRISCSYFWLLMLLNTFLCLRTSMFLWWGYLSVRCFSKLSFLFLENHLFASQIYLIFIIDCTQKILAQKVPLDYPFDQRWPEYQTLCECQFMINLGGIPCSTAQSPLQDTKPSFKQAT